MKPLEDIRIIEIGSLGPVPFAGMMFADMGAEVIRIDRPGQRDPLRQLLGRGRSSIVIDLKQDAGVDLARRLVGSADVMIEGLRPGVIERLGLHPDDLLDADPALIVGRMTGWGQDGPYADQAGHDINYLGVTGGLFAIGHADAPPPPPLNLIADYGGGAMFLVAGVLAALVERARSGQGQVVDVAMIDGVSSLLTMFHEMAELGAWTDSRESNLLDGGAPFYRTYATADGKYMSVGALEPQFYAEFVHGLGIDGNELPAQHDVVRWPETRALFASVFAAHPQSHWIDVFAGGDACVFPVRSLAEAHLDPQMDHRTKTSGSEVAQAGIAAPRLSRTPLSVAPPARLEGADTVRILTGLGYSASACADLRRSGVVG